MVLLRAAEEGGELVVGGAVAPLEEGVAIEMRADVEEHEVREVRRGARVSLTVGCLDALTR